MTVKTADVAHTLLVLGARLQVGSADPMRPGLRPGPDDVAVMIRYAGPPDLPLADVVRSATLPADFETADDVIRAIRQEVLHPWAVAWIDRGTEFMAAEGGR